MQLIIDAMKQKGWECISQNEHVVITEDLSKEKHPELQFATFKKDDKIASIYTDGINQIISGNGCEELAEEIINWENTKLLFLEDEN